MNPFARTALVCLLACLALMGCGLGKSGNAPPPAHPDTAHYAASASPRIALMAGFSSYSSEAEVISQLTDAGYAAQRKVLSKAPSARYPARTTTLLEVNSFSHLGQPGTLCLTLFNNRLMEAEFRPSEAKPYARALQQALPQLKRDSSGVGELLSGNLRIFSNVDLAASRVGGHLGTDALVLWQDRRLIDQRNEWDERFGGIPEPVR